jgi:hypothetical protein
MGQLYELGECVDVMVIPRVGKGTEGTNYSGGSGYIGFVGCSVEEGKEVLEGLLVAGGEP